VTTGRSVRRRFAEAGTILLVGAGLFVAGEGATGGLHWFRWPIELVGGTLLVVGVLWVPATLGLPLLRRPLAGMIAAQIEADGIVTGLAERIRPAILEAAAASVPPVQINTGRIASEIVKEIRPAIAEAIASSVPPVPSPERFASLVVAEIEKRTALPTPDREAQERRRVIAHKVATDLEGQRLKLLERLNDLNPHLLGEWANPKSQDLLRAEPKYAVAVRLTDRAYQALALVNPKSMLLYEQPRIDGADKQIVAAVRELDLARESDQ
jgi:hypothetical protein